MRSGKPEGGRTEVYRLARRQIRCAGSRREDVPLATGTPIWHEFEGAAGRLIRVVLPHHSTGNQSKLFVSIVRHRGWSQGMVLLGGQLL